MAKAKTTGNSVKITFGKKSGKGKYKKKYGPKNKSQKLIKVKVDKNKPII